MALELDDKATDKEKRNAKLITLLLCNAILLQKLETRRRNNESDKAYKEILAFLGIVLDLCDGNGDVLNQQVRDLARELGMEIELHFVDLTRQADA